MSSQPRNYNVMKHPRRGDYDDARKANDVERHLFGTITNPPINRWSVDTAAETTRRVRAVMEFIGIEPTLRGFRRGFFWVLANPGAITALQAPKGKRPISETETLPPGMQRGARDTHDRPIKDRTHTLLAAYRQHLQDGLSKVAAANLTASEYNIAARQQGDADPRFQMPVPTSPAAIKKLDERYPDELPLSGLAEAMADEKRAWPRELERLAPPLDFFVLSVELKVEALAAGRCSPEDFQEAMQILTQQHLESHAIRFDATF